MVSREIWIKQALVSSLKTSNNNNTINTDMERTTEINNPKPQQIFSCHFQEYSERILLLRSFLNFRPWRPTYMEDNLCQM
jgi:hypothetical protein